MLAKIWNHWLNYFSFFCLIVSKSPSRGSMAETQVDVEMDDLTKKEDHLTIKCVQPSRKGNENGDGVGDGEGSTGDNNGQGAGDGDGDGNNDGDGKSDGDGNRNGHGNAQGNAKENLIKDIERGNIDEILQVLTPKALAKCGRNALLVAMEVNSKLRTLAKKKGPGAEEFSKMASSVDEYTSCLLDPLKSNVEARHVLGDSLDDLMDTGIDMKQKTFFAHPVIFDLMNDKWLGKFDRMKRCSWLSLQSLLWILLHIWCLFDLVMFPFLFAVFYLKHCRKKNKLEDKGIEIAFLINATSKNADKTFNLMSRSIKEFVDKHGDDNTNYQVFIHGDDSDSPIKMYSKSSIDRLELKRGTTEIPALHEDLQNADFLIRSSKKKSEKVIIFFTDHKTSLKHERFLVESQVKAMKDIKLLPVAIGPHVNIRELETITDNKQEIIHFGEYENPDTVSTRIWHDLQGKDMYESYHEYFTTPYFIFVRDTLTYLTLLGLHIALCLSPSVIPFSGLEWVIMVFFMGRILLESKQFRNVKINQGRGIVIKKQMGDKYTRCSENEEQGAQNEIRGVENGEGGEDEGSCRVSKLTMCPKMCGKYLSDRWNILDSITLVIYLITFLLRMLTWATSASVPNNRALVIAGYLYGLNTMFLTLRAFGHVMETIRGIGTIQIALFQIIGDIATIFWQFLATILAFSIAITKVYMAEKSYIAQESYNDNLACNTSGISCWWEMFKHLCWSLLGIAELDPLDSVDSASVTLAKLLFGTFLIMGVVLLVNMMIALLSNTYQRVEDNAYKEWSFKKALTIQTYSSYHPIPVPLNLISNLCVGVKCVACCKGQEDGNDAKARNKSLDAVVQNLQKTYFETYGNSFPLTDDRKMDQLIEETARNREMINQIARRTFTTNVPDQAMLLTGQGAWQSKGIRIEGSLLVCEGGKFCETCQRESDECHGARYLTPFSPERPHFEVLILETGERRSLGLGVVWRDYGNHAMPGQRKKTVGYLVDEGKILAEKEYEGAMAYRGDLIGCTVMFQELKDGKVPIQFTLNGKQITQDKIFIEYNPPEKSLYPFIGMGHTGMTVLAKLCTSPNNDDHLIGAIKATTDSMTKTMAFNWRQVDAIVRQTKGELSKSAGEFVELYSMVSKWLARLERLLIDLDQVGRDEAIDELENWTMPGDELFGGLESGVDMFPWAEPWLEPSREEELSYLNEKDGPGLEDQQPQNSLLKRAHKDLEKLKQTADRKFDSVVESLTEAKNEANERMRYQEDSTERVKTKLRSVQQSLKHFLKARLS